MQPDDAYFWATHQGAELDLLLFKDGRRLGVEAKRDLSAEQTAGRLGAGAGLTPPPHPGPPYSWLEICR